MLLGDNIQTVRVTVDGDSVYCRARCAVQRIVPWGPRAGAWRRGSRRDWQEFSPRVDIAFIEELAAANPEERGVWTERRQRIQAARFLVAHWPAEARDRTGRLPGWHWQVLQFVNRGGEPALQLLRSNPALAFLLATEPLPGELPELLGRRRRDLLPVFGFSATGQAVRLLQKIPAACVKPDVLADLREASADAETAAWLSHLPRINPAVLAVARDRALRNRFSPACLARLARAQRPLPQCDLAARVRELAEMAQQANVAVPLIRNLSDIDNAFRPVQPPPPVHHRAAPRNAGPVPDRFPPPPVEPIPGIEPIETHAGLLLEGARMHHCVGGDYYASRIARRRLYVYRMTSPERLTIAICRSRRSWRISEVQGPCNRAPSPGSLDLIRGWLGEPAPTPPPLPVFGVVPERPAPPRRDAREEETPQMGFDFGEG